MYSVSENNTFAEIGGEDRTVQVRSAQTGDVMKRLDEVDDLIHSVSFNNGSYMALGCHNGDILIYDTENGCSQIQRLTRTYVDDDSDNDSEYDSDDDSEYESDDDSDDDSEYDSDDDSDDDSEYDSDDDKDDDSEEMYIC